MTSPVQLQAEFEAKMLAHVQSLGRTPIVWEETFAAIANVLPPTTVVEVWSNASLLEQAMAQGFPVGRATCADLLCLK